MSHLVLSFPQEPWAPIGGWEGEDPHPRYEDYPTHQAYEEAFHLWRARQRDGRLNSEELAAQFEVIEAAILSRGR